ncbi:MAG: 2-C-methyl-D-erythritol 4-phosphate cytidylyltransferase [Alphaproteobacteria bacterium]
MTNYVIILSGGFGSRFGSDKPKQFVKIGGDPILWHTIKAFNDSEIIDKIIVVANRDYVTQTKEIASDFAKVCKVVEGGKETRSQSSYNGVMAIKADDNDNVLIHDGARPFVSDEIIKNCIKSLSKNKCVATVLPATDTLYEIKGKKVVNIPNRDNFVMVQTPQGFKYDVLKSAYEKFDNKASFSDDVSLVKKYIKDTDVCIVNGDKKNIKITTEDDLLLVRDI